jgi:predicted permease
MFFYFTRFGRKLIGFFRREQIARDLAEEIETHRLLLEQASAHKDHGRQIGNITLAREESRDVWTFAFVDALFRDSRQAFRGLVRNPAFTATAIISLALGIGANTAIFTAVSAIFLKPLAVRDPSTLVTFSAIDARGLRRNSFPLAFASQLAAFGALRDVIATSSDGLSFQYGDRAERIMGEVVTPNFFPALGIKPVLGEGFSGDVRSGKWAPEAVLSYSFWKGRFAGDPSVIGRSIRLNTHPFTIVGVSPSSFYDLHQGQDPEVRVPLLPLGRKLSELNLLNPEQDFHLMARLAPGMSRGAAQSAASIQLREFTRSSPDAQTRRLGYRELRIVPGARGWPVLSAQFKTPLIVLFLLVFVVLLIACANVANMSLARAGVRRREIAVRASLGAGRGRLIQQMIIESLLLACFAGIAGFLVARYVSQFLLHFLPQGHIQLVLDLRPTPGSLVFTLGLSALAALLFGLTTAFQSTRGNLVSGLKSDSNGSVGGAEAHMLKKALLVGQIAFSLALLIVAGVFIRTVLNLRPDTDFPDSSRILAFTMKPQQEIYNASRVRTIVDEVIRRVSALPGVEAVGLAESGPFSSLPLGDVVQVSGRAPVAIEMDIATPGLLKTLGLHLRSGRDFTPGDGPESLKVVILNQSLAQALFPNQLPLGRIIDLPRAEGPLHFRVIGVVADTHYFDLHRIQPTAFFAFQLGPPYMPTLHVRVASSNAAAYIPAIRREFDALDKGFPVFNVRTLSDRIDDALARERMIADLSTIFGALALGLAAVGLYGVFTYSVTQRTREIGLRMALGSNIPDVLWLVTRDALLLAGIGIGIGSAVAVGGTYFLSNQLYGVAPADPLNLIASAASMLLIALLAVFLPAWRASRTDPMIALRHD